MLNEQKSSIATSVKMGIVTGIISGVQAGTIMALLVPIALIIGYVTTAIANGSVSSAFAFDNTTIWPTVLLILLWWLMIAILGGLAGLLGGAIGGPLLTLYVTRKHWTILATLLGAILGFTTVLLIGLLESRQNFLGFSGAVIGTFAYATITGTLGGYLGGRRLRNRKD